MAPHFFGKVILLSVTTQNLRLTKLEINADHNCPKHQNVGLLTAVSQSSAHNIGRTTMGFTGGCVVLVTVQVTPLRFQ